MSSSVTRFRLYLVDGRLRVRCLSGKRFQRRCQAYRSHLVVVWYTSGELFTVVPKSPLVFPDDHYQDDNATPHHARVVLNILQPSNVTRMEQPARSPDCNPIEHIWDELGSAIPSMDNPPQNLGELRQALQDKWAEIPLE